MLPAVVPAAANRVPPSGPGSGTAAHVDPPVQCRMSACLTVWVLATPTAHALPGALAATPNSRLVTPGLGLGTARQLRPFQNRVSVPVPLPVFWAPTAQA